MMLKKLISIFIFATTSVATFANHGPRIQFVNNMYSDSLADLDIWYSLKNYPGAFKIDSSLNNYKEATAFLQTTLIYGDVSFYVTSGGSLDTLGYLIKQTFGSPQIEYDKYYAIVLSGNSTKNLKGQRVRIGIRQPVDPSIKEQQDLYQFIDNIMLQAADLYINQFSKNENKYKIYYYLCCKI